MGSVLRLTVAGSSAGVAGRAWAAVRHEMAATESELTRFDAASSLSQTNRMAGSGAWLEAEPRLRRMLSAADRALRITGGRFDPRIIGALEAIGERGGVPLPPTSTSGPWLERDGRSARVRLTAAADSGGIGKGLALRWALTAARAAAPGAGGLLLDAGGDIHTSGGGPDGGPWSVGVEDPARPDRLLATIAVRSGAVATSSIGQRRWIHAGRQVHHLIDPRRGLPASTGLVAVTVALSDPAWAEVWTKALFLGGRRAIGDEARSRGLAAWWVEDDGTLHMTPAARQQTTWIASETTAA